MRFDTWTKEEKKLLDMDYRQLFADQVTMMKKLYRFKSDQSLCDDIIESVSRVLFKLLKENHLEFAGSLIERMFLSIIPYDVMIYQQRNFSDYNIDLYFYDTHQIFSYRKIEISSTEDLKKIIEMMMFIGRKYDQLSLHQIEDLKSVSAQQLILGFDEKFLQTKMTHLYQPYHIQ